jgi:hypothetical protein
VKGRPSLFWMDWRLRGRSMAVSSFTRAVFYALLGFAFLALLLSGGARRFLASRYAATAVLAPSVSEGEAEGLARKIAGMPPVASAAYRNPEAAWKEFLQAYPGLESIRSSAGNPLPGYVEIRFRYDRLTAEDVDMVVSALRNVPAVKTVLAGEASFPRILRVATLSEAVCWCVFGAFAAAFLMICWHQERARAIGMEKDFTFLSERGISAARMAACRAAGAGIAALILSAAGIAGAGAALFFLLQRFHVLQSVIGPPEALLLPAIASSAAFFPGCAALSAAFLSLLGWRAARSGVK